MEEIESVMEECEEALERDFGPPGKEGTSGRAETPQAPGYHRQEDGGREEDGEGDFLPHLGLVWVDGVLVTQAPLENENWGGGEGDGY